MIHRDWWSQRRSPSGPDPARALAPCSRQLAMRCWHWRAEAKGLVRTVWGIYRYWSRRTIKRGTENNQDWYPYRKYRYQQLQNMRGKCCPPWGPMGVCGGPVGPRGAPWGPRGAPWGQQSMFNHRGPCFRENNQVCLKYHFQIPIPIPPKFNQKKAKYQYDTGKYPTLRGGAAGPVHASQTAAQTADSAAKTKGSDLYTLVTTDRF